jgi:pimeloyl-ACP methyl ester carboxylesterase
MPQIQINGAALSYEQTGEGASLVFVHGAFVDWRIWDPQWKTFASRYQLVRYDLRGHGQSVPSTLQRYCMDTFADDLAALLDALQIQSAFICGLSWGGSIVQAFAVRYPDRCRALILSGSAVAIDLTPKDKLFCKVLFPGWAMSLAIRTMNVKHFTRFSIWLAGLTLGKQWLSRDEQARQYLEQCMYAMDRNEYLKIWQAIYGFHLLALEKISCPVLVLNGEHESANTFRHTQEILRRVPQARAAIVPAALHAMNLEQPQVFNALLQEFLNRVP